MANIKKYNDKHDDIKLFDKKCLAITNIIMDEYYEAIRIKYQFLIDKRDYLEEQYECATPSLEYFNQKVWYKEIHAKIEFSYLIRLWGPVPIAISFNDLLFFPLEDKYNDKVKELDKITINPIINLEKILLFLKLKKLNDYEWELLRRGIEEVVDNNDLLNKIVPLRWDINKYKEKYMIGSSAIDYDVLKEVMRKLYDENIISDKLLIEITGKNKKKKQKDKDKDIDKKLADLSEYLEQNLYFYDYMRKTKMNRSLSEFDESSSTEDKEKRFYIKTGSTKVVG